MDTKRPSSSLNAISHSSTKNRFAHQSTRYPASTATQIQICSFTHPPRSSRHDRNLLPYYPSISQQYKRSPGSLAAMPRLFILARNPTERSFLVVYHHSGSTVHLPTFQSHPRRTPSSLQEPPFEVDNITGEALHGQFTLRVQKSVIWCSGHPRAGF